MELAAQEGRRQTLHPVSVSTPAGQAGAKGSEQPPSPGWFPQPHPRAVGHSFSHSEQPSGGRMGRASVQPRTASTGLLCGLPRREGSAARGPRSRARGDTKGPSGLPGGAGGRAAGRAQVAGGLGGVSPCPVLLLIFPLFLGPRLPGLPLPPGRRTEALLAPPPGFPVGGIPPGETPEPPARHRGFVTVAFSSLHHAVTFAGTSVETVGDKTARCGEGIGGMPGLRPPTGAAGCSPGCPLRCPGVTAQL